MLNPSGPSEPSMIGFLAAAKTLSIVKIDASCQASSYLGFEVGFGNARQRLVVR